MVRAEEKLEALVEMLERSGDDAERLEVARRAQRFKRSWVELGEGLSRLRKTRSFEKWGYRDLHEYARMELHIQAATVDKLTVSFATLERHAPSVLKRDGLTRELPSLDAVEYFGRTMGVVPEGKEPREPVDAPRDVVDELRAAVFDDGAGVSELRRRFNPVLYPKDPDTERRDLVRRTRSTAAKLGELVRSLDGLSDARIERVETALAGLLKDLEALVSGKVPAMAKSARRGRGRGRVKRRRR